MTARTERLMATLEATDPGFKTLTNLLYGSDVPLDEVYEDVFKADGDPPQSNHLLRRVALASTLAGSVLAGREIGEGLGLVKVAESTPAKKIAIGGAALAGDAVTTAALALKRKPQQTPADPTAQSVAKGSVNELAEGVLRGAKKASKLAEVPNQLSMFDHGLAPAAEQNRTTNEFKTQARAKKAAGMVHDPLGSAKKLVNTPPKAAVAGATGALALQHHPRKKAGMSDQQYYQDYNTAKRDEPTKDFVAEGTFSKLDTDKHLAFGWASVVEKNGMPVVDRQGDYMTLEDVEDAAYRYVISSRIGGDMHKRNGDQPHHVSDLVESMVVTPEKLERLGVPTEVAKSMPTGWWVGFKIHDPATWDLVKKGQRAGFSIHGKGRRSLHDLDDAMGY